MVRGVVFAGDGTYEQRDFPMPEPPPGGAVLQVEAVGMCASDVAQLHGHHHVPGETAPVVPGHEIVGRVHALGADADLGVAVGQRVGVDLVRRCGTCSACDAGGRGCRTLDIYGYTFGLAERSGLYGGYGQYMEILSGTHLVPLPDDVPAEELSLFEPLASAVNWIKLCRVRAHDTVVIQGPGHMGLICLAVALHAGAKTVIVTGTGQDTMRLEAARDIGATHTIDVDNEDLVARVGEITGGAMASVVIDVADAATQTVPLAVEMAQPGGRILLAGLKNFAPVELVTDLIVLKSLTLVGGSGSTPETMDAAGALLRDKVLPTAKLKGRVFTLDELDEAMAYLTRTDGRDAIRVGLLHQH